MDKTDIIFNLAEILGCEARKYEPLSKHTTFKIGGVADTYVKVTSLSKLSTILKECRESDIDYMIIGNGSNILASDDGYRGVVIRLDGDFRKIALVDDDTVYCGAGATLAALCKFALNNGLSGLEFAWGLPGRVGGAVFMTAGAYAGALIEQCGLKGHSHGGAQVSEKHAGFIINKANANANDVKSLIREVQTKVYDETGYNLECELIIL